MMYLVEKYGDSSPEDAMIEAQSRAAIDFALETLTSREQMVVRLRFGLDDGDGHSFSSIGEALGGISSTRCNQIYNKSLRKLRHPMRLVPILAAVYGAQPGDFHFDLYLDNLHRTLVKATRALVEGLRDQQVMIKFGYPGGEDPEEQQARVDQLRKKWRHWRDVWEDETETTEDDEEGERTYRNIYAQ